MESGVMLNFVVELTGLALCGLSILMVLVSPKTGQCEKNFILYYVCLFLYAGSNLAGLFMRGHPGAAVRVGLRISNFVEFLMAFLILCVISEHLLFSVDREKALKAERVVMRSLILANIALLVVSQFTGLYYVIDEFNVYRRGAGYPLSYVFPALIIIMDVWILTRRGHRMTPRGVFVCWIYAAVGVAAIVLQIFIYGIYFTVYAGIIIALIMYIVIMQNQAERYYRQEAENAHLKMDIMLNQIQPHFLYNSLTAIQDLCHSDPAQAEAAIVKFSRYLRGNMDSLRTERAIPFEEELSHTKIYLELEQMRFEDKLTVRYDISCADFALPPLSLQPIVENAVRHGVRGNADGAGVVTIATREYPDRYEVSVTDDGPGFRPAAPPTDNQRSHIGIKNVRERLSRICGGKLDIASEIGRGTTVTIALPKAEESGAAEAGRGKGNKHVDFRVGRRAKSPEYPLPGYYRGRTGRGTAEI